MFSADPHFVPLVGVYKKIIIIAYMQVEPRLQTMLVWSTNFSKSQQMEKRKCKGWVCERHIAKKIKGFT